MGDTADSDAKQPDYRINLEEKYGHSTLVDIPADVAACTDEWFNQTLTSVNDAVVRLGIIEGEFHWHQHDDEDEFFLVLDGRLEIDIEDGETTVLDRHQGFTVPRGVVHRTRAPQRAVIVMVEAAGVVPTGD
jgi:mannose-6-phosphate isomerase-like protein (cupin superfamily)